MTVVETAPRSARTAAFHTLTVAAVETLCEDAAAVTFDVPPELAEDYAFLPGQSLTLRRTVGGREERRSYSICAPVGARPRIGVREIPDGLFSTWLVHDVRPGDEIEVQVPTGSFTADPRAGGRHLCIAAGSGITPMLSIATSLLTHGDAEVALLYGNRTSGSVMFAEDLGDLKNAFGSRLQLVHVLSREPRDAELFSGRLDADRIRRILDVLLPVEQFDDVWLCGPFAMINDAREVLTELGVAADRIHFELFYVDEPPPELKRLDRVYDGATTDVTIVLDGLSATAALPRDQSILDAAQASRSDLPFACKGGVCGTCRAKVTDGVVDMRRNYALEPAEVDAGFVLTCQSYPVGDCVTVDFDA
ncbi:ring-1,2-phenylacetyl-CoA epoxidase subunit PaaE [Nocardioides terrae]|uniref:Ring-1,2-phenylacetyl-CoA epoxidase subunit PaaE n=1 Tax=Nocardioides terrae TaxID=574651 RepID=A0A1I1DP99_9ACTN|nr:1,2-phenylacetyl-CoA epoxidase subunit PaaE [Nocardioides terrae]SFB76785.1 ring-1,2-phenylacetyl-CoA epoxidase subunit PaaE [Nocardioides terrae]